MSAQIIKSTFQSSGTSQGCPQAAFPGTSRFRSAPSSKQRVTKLDSRPPRTPLIWAGGKAAPALYPPIAGAIDLTGINRFVEPFCGGAALSLAVLRDTDLRVWLNDIDAAIASFWAAVFDGTAAQAVAKVRATNQAPTRSEYVAMQRNIRAGNRDPYEILVVSRFSRSGTFTQGGMRSDAAKRWIHRDRWCETIESLRVYADRVAVTDRDGIAVIDDLTSSDFALVDPPYPGVGDSLYRNRMPKADHARLAFALRRTPARWLMSSTPDAASLYARLCEIEEIGKSGRRTTEVIITPR